MIPGVRLVVLGKQGAGKGTQCVRLSHHYVVPHVSTGDMLRSEVKSRSGIGQRAASLMEKGELIPDDLVMEMVGGRLSERDTTGRGFVLDGCPRTTGTGRVAREDRRALRPRPGDRPAGPDHPGDEAARLAPRLRGLRRQLLHRRPAPGELDLRRVRRRGRPARGRHRGGDRAQAQPLRGGDRPAAPLVQGAQPAGRDQRHRLPRRRDPARGGRHRHACASSRRSAPLP